MGEDYPARIRVVSIVENEDVADPPSDGTMA